jgi:hypothetical protein
MVAVGSQEQESPLIADVVDVGDSHRLASGSRLPRYTYAVPFEQL